MWEKDGILATALPSNICPCLQSSWIWFLYVKPRKSNPRGQALLFEAWEQTFWHNFSWACCVEDKECEWFPAMQHVAHQACNILCTRGGLYRNLARDHNAEHDSFPEGRSSPSCLHMPSQSPTLSRFNINYLICGFPKACLNMRFLHPNMSQGRGITSYTNASLLQVNSPKESVFHLPKHHVPSEHILGPDLPLSRTTYYLPDMLQIMPLGDLFLIFKIRSASPKDSLIFISQD